MRDVYDALTQDNNTQDNNTQDNTQDKTQDHIQDQTRESAHESARGNSDETLSAVPGGPGDVQEGPVQEVYMRSAISRHPIGFTNITRWRRWQRPRQASGPWAVAAAVPLMRGAW